VSNPTQCVTVTVIVESGATEEEQRLTRTVACYSLTGAHDVLMAGFKTHTTPAIITALAVSAVRLDGLALRAGAGELAASA